MDEKLLELQTKLDMMVLVMDIVQKELGEIRARLNVLEAR